MTNTMDMNGESEIVNEAVETSKAAEPCSQSEHIKHNTEEGTGVHNSSANTDTSDIEVIEDCEEQDSAESIEVLDPKVCEVNTVVDCCDDAVYSDESETTEHVDFDHVQHGDHTPAQELISHCGESAIMQSISSDNVQSSEVGEVTADEVKEGENKLLGRTRSQDQSGYASDSSFSRGSPMAGSDVEHLLATDNFSDSSGYTDDIPQNSSSPFGSPIHRAHNVDVQLENGSLINRPDSLSLPKPLQFYERQKLSKKESSSTISSYSSRSSSMDALIEAASSTPLRTQGTVMREGDMVAFVADGLQEMIKRSSSPLTKSSGSQTPSARSVSSMSSSTSGWSMSNSSVSGYSYSGLSRSPSIMNQSPEDIPPIDPKAVTDLEAHAKKVSDSLNHMMGTLKINLHKMSAITYSCLDAYKDGIDSTCDSVDGSIKSMYALMAKCEELSKTMRPIYPLHEQIKEIKRLLDLFEAQMAKDDK